MARGFRMGVGGGKSKELITYLLKNGVFADGQSLMGGYSSNGYKNLTYSINNNSATAVTSQAGAWCYSSVFLANPIDVTNVKRIHIEGRFTLTSGTIATKNEVICLTKTSPSLSGGYTRYVVTTQASNDTFSYDLDVSQLAGLYYICYVNDSGASSSTRLNLTITFTNIYTESVDESKCKYLYKDGEEYDTITGGWTEAGYGGYAQSGRTNCTVTNVNNNLKVEHASTQYTDYGCMSTKTTDKVNVSGYSRLSMKFTTSVDTGQQYLSLDISGITGAYYIGAYINYITSSVNDMCGLCLVSKEGLANQSQMIARVETANTHIYDASTVMYIQEIWLDE